MTARILSVVCALLTAALPLDAQRRGGPAAATARISGRVIDAASGAPLAGASVSLEVVKLAAAAESAAVPAARTDANGGFDFSGLAPGEYQLKAAKTGYLPQTIGGREAGGERVTARSGDGLPRVTVAMIKGGAISGRIVDEFGEPLARVPVNVRRFQYDSDGRRTVVPVGIADGTDDLGQFRVYGLPAGDFLVVLQSARGPNEPIGAFADVISSDIAPTYYPGTVNAADAQVVSLAAGGEASVQFTPVPPVLVRVLGSVVTSDGKPAAGLTVSLRAASADWVAARSLGRLASDGLFLISRVAPGRYWLDVGSDDGIGESASVPIVVGTDEVDGVVIVTAPGATVSGRVVFEGTTSRPPAFRLRAVPAVPGPAIARQAGDEAGPAADGAFQLTGLTGRVLLASTDDDWIVKSVTVDGEEVADEPFDVTARGTIARVRVVVTNRLAAITGRVTGNDGRPLADHMAVVMRTDRTGMARQRIRLTRTDADGRFALDRLRPGTYLAAVVGDLGSNHHFSTEFQERLGLYGHRLSLGEGERATLDLRPIAGLP